MNCIGTYDGTIFYNPANKFCIISVKTADQSVPAEARSNWMVNGQKASMVSSSRWSSGVKLCPEQKTA